MDDILHLMFCLPIVGGFNPRLKVTTMVHFSLGRTPATIAVEPATRLYAIKPNGQEADRAGSTGLADAA